MNNLSKLLQAQQPFNLVRRGTLACAMMLALRVPCTAWAQAQPTQDTARPVSMLGVINVTATLPDATIKAQQHMVPGGVSVLDGETFYQRQVTNLADALRYTPGVMIQSKSGGDDQELSIRGSNLSALGYDNSGVALFQDGLPISTADGNNHNRLFDPLAASNIIVARGANALTYGASELGGAIDTISLTARNSDPREIYLTGGSYGLFDGKISTGGISGDVDGMLTFDGKHFDGYQQHTREDRTSLYGNVGWRASDDLDLRLFGTYIDRRQELAGSLTRAEYDDDPRQADPSYVLGDHQINVKTHRAALKGDWRINANSSLEFGLSYEHQSLYHPIVDVYNFGTTPPTQYFSLLIDTKQDTTGGMLRYHYTVGNHKLLAGLNAAHTDNRGGNYTNDEGQRGVKTDDISQQSNNVTLFMLDRWQFAPQWTLVYGTQGVITDRDLRDTSLAYGGVRHQTATYSSLNPRLGLIYALGPDSEVFANISRIYEAPNNFDLDNDVRQDDSTLDAMHGIQYELGTRGKGKLPNQLGTGHWSLSVYYAKIHDEILSVENPAQPGNMLATNYDKTTHAGIEALAGASFALANPSHRIEPLISATYNDFSFNNDPAFGNNRLPSAPRYIVHGEVMYRDRQTGFYAGPTFDIVGSRYADMANDYHVDGYELVGLRAGIERDRWELYAQVTNLTNKKYVNSVAVLTQADANARVLNPGAPRSVFVGLRVHY